MAFDINWNLLTDSSANLGNALANIGQQVGERRRAARTNNALADAMADPKNVEAQDNLRRIDPRLAMQTEEMQRQKVARLQDDERKELGVAARVFANVADEAGYLGGVATMKRLGFDVSDYPAAFDPAQMKEIVRLGGYVNQADPIKVSEGDLLIDPITKQVVARGNPKPPRMYPVAAGGSLVPEPVNPQQPVQISNDEQYNALQSGTPFIGPDGVVRVKP